MALPMIETGYKPEFSLGAVYQGFNAGNADMSAQEEIIKQFLANQREQQMQPLDVDIKQYDAALANAKRADPNFIPWQLAGQSGQMMSQDASGRSAQSLFGDKLAADRQKLQNDLVTGQATNIFSKEQLQMLQDLKSGNTPYAGTGQVGFPMQPQEPEPQGRIASQWGGEGLSVPVPKGDYSRENNLRGLMGTDYRSGTKDYDFETIDKEIARTKDPKILAILQEERKRMEAEFGGAQPKTSVFSSMQKSTGSGDTPWGDLMPRNSVLGRMAGTMAMTPETVAKLAGGEQRAQSAVEVAQIKAEADAAKANAKLTEPKYKEQLAEAFRIMAKPDATPQEKYQAEMFIYLDKQTRLAANPGAYQQRFDLGSQGLPMTPAPVNQQKTPVAPSEKPTEGKTSSGVGYKIVK